MPGADCLNDPGFDAHLTTGMVGIMTTKYSLEVRTKAVRLVREHLDDYGSEWETIKVVSGRLGMTPETLRKWMRQADIDDGFTVGVSTAETARIRELERKNAELEKTVEILKAASAFFARELDSEQL